MSESNSNTSTKTESNKVIESNDKNNINSDNTSTGILLTKPILKSYEKQTESNILKDEDIKRIMKDIFLIYKNDSLNKSELYKILEENFIDFVKNSPEIIERIKKLVYNYITYR